ncbi:MAG TPA: E2 domain-containing protein [Herbaspirillum sp.]|uniref:E2 domain-containing protein n=1 Tax=Herbaspirillum sp. TaxID=1890675 RepID=UPI002D5A3A68|nr:E2 domain-containing protein [Herbaspirillum sp.]HZG18851.1 E2 domain-containing protein [Herbaspirillum sp.]
MVYALELIASLAAEYESQVVEHDTYSLTLDVRLRRADNRIAPYRILARAMDGNVSAQEETPARLPARCPERHINGDGTFCMYWQGEMSLKIDSDEAAHTWWATLLGYLKLQERAEKLRRWPDDNAWAHGNAASHQQKAIAAAARITSQLEAEVKRRRVQAKQKGPHGRRPQMIYVSQQGSLLYSVRILHQPTFKAAVTRLRQPCLCGLRKRKNGRPVALRKCPRHADAARDLALELVKWEKEEEKFWANYKGKQCCGKMASCPLAANGVITTVTEG